MRSVPAQLRRSRPRLHGRLLAVGAAVLALVAAGLQQQSQQLVFAGPPRSRAAPPYGRSRRRACRRYIFPYVDSANISNLNLFDLQYLMYRPLYWFGQNGQPG